MNPATETQQQPQYQEPPVSKRYKSYPASHFSWWRAWAQRFTMHFLVIPWLVLKCKPSVYGKSNVPRTGPFIVAANHISMLDPPLIAYAINYPIAYMAKRELFKHLWAAEFYRFQGTFALDRDNPDSATLKTAFNVLRSPGKWALGIFPEGTRSRTGEILPLKKGVGALAQKTGVPVLPIGIRKEPDGRVIIRIGQMIHDVSNAEAVQEQVYQALVTLTTPDEATIDLRDEAGVTDQTPIKSV